MTAEKIAELKRWLVIAQQPYNPRYKAAKRDAQARVTRFVPELIVALEAATAERDLWRNKCLIAQAKLENMAIDCGQAEGQLKRYREEAEELRRKGING